MGGILNMYEYTRSDFLRALLNQKKALNANSNSLVNPSLPQADNIANLAALNTSFSGTTSTPAPENVDNERNDWQRTIDTAREFGSNITEGVLGFLDGISDAIAYGYGAISGDQSGALDWMNYDWQAQTLNALNQLDLAGNVATGDIFSKDYWDNWQTVGSAAQSRDQINRLHQNSWTSELGENQQMYNAITQGIGSALPSIVLGIVTGGMSTAAQAAITMGTMGVSAFGGGAAEALNDGASYGQAAAYGGVSAGIEMLTETISGTIGGVATSFLKKGQQKVVKEVAEEGFKKIAKATIKEMMSEGLEETVSTLANPLAKAATYKGTEAFKEYGTPDLWIEAAVSFASGALGGGVGSTASRVHLTNTYSKQGLQALDALNNANKLEKEYVKRISSGESVETLSEEYGVEYSNNIKKAVEIIQKMQKSDTVHYTKLMEAITGNSSKTTSINEYDEIVEKGLKPRVDETITQRYAKNIGSRIGVDINLVEDSMLQNAEAFMKATGIELTPEQIQQFNDPTTVKKGLNIDGKVYISDAYQNDINQLIMHEAISHGYLDSNKELRESLMMSITSNGKLLTKLKEIKDETYKAYGLDKIQVLKDLDARKTSASDVHASETVAKFLEFLYSNNDISSVLNSLNKSKLSAMLSRAIRYLGTKGDSTKQARLKLEKALAKLKGTNIDKDLKFAKAKTPTTASTPTQTTPKNTPKPASYYDYFNPNGTIKSSVVNRVAKANLGKTISTADSKFIVAVALQAIENTLGMSGNLSLNDFTTVARTFFEQYNLNDGNFYRSKAYNNLIEKLLDTTITYETTIEVDGKKQKIKSKTTLRAFIQADPVNSGFNSVDEFKTTFTQFIDEMIEHYGKPTKLQKAFDKFNQKIKETTDRLEEYTYTTTQNAKLTYETAKLSKQISEDFRDKKIKSYVGIEIPELSIIRDLIKSINPDSKFMTITSNSIENLIQRFEAIDYRKDSPTLEKMGIEFNQEWYDMFDYFRDLRKEYIHFDKDTGERTIRKKFPARALTLDETQMLHTFMKQVKELLKDIKSGKEQEMRKMFSKGTTNIRVVLNRTDTNKNSSNLLKRELDYVTSPDVMIGETFGFNSEIKKICFDDLLEAYINQQGAEQKFIDKFNNLAKKLKGKNKLTKKVEIEWNGTKYYVENDILVDIYLHSLATENRKVLLKKGYTFTYKGKERTIKFNEEMITELESKLTPELKEFASSISNYYNDELKAYAKKHGIDVLENVVYYPRTRSDVSNTQTDNLMQKFKSLNPDTLPINQQRKNQGNNPLAGMGASARIKSYINQVTKIGELTKALDIYSKFLNTKVYYKGNMVSRNELIKHINKDWTTWKEYIENQVAGIPVSNEVKKSGLFQNLIASTLGLNISTVLKQTASIPTIMTNVHLSSFLKGVFDIKNTTKTSFTYKKIKAMLMEESPLLYKRFSENQVILAQGLTKQLGKISKAVMLPIEAMDEGIILTFCYQTAYYEAEFLLSKNGTPTKDEIHKKAIKILERIVLNTQSNSVAPKMSMARAGAKGYMRKALSVFTSDLNNIVNIWREVISSRKVALKNIESIEQMIKQTKSDLETIPQEIRDEIAQKTKLLNGLSGKEKTKMENIIQKLEEKLQSETNRLTLELDNLNKLLEENKVNADLGDKTKQLLKLLLVMALKGVTIAAVGQLVDRLYGRKDWDENTIDDFVKVAILESTIYNIPYVQTFVSAMEFDQPVGGFEFTQINDTLSLITDVIEELNKDNPNYYSLAYKFATTVGQFTGIPFKNIYNIVMGVWKNSDPSGHEWDGIIKGYSDSYMLQQYKEATKVGRDYQAKGYFETLMKTNKVSVYSDKVQKEIINLTKDGYNAMPKNFMTSYIDENGNEVNLTDDQIKMFRTAYNESNKAIEALMNVTEYKTLTQEEKAKQIKKIYDLYYSYAKAKTLKTPPTGRAEKLLYYTHGKVNIGKYTNVLNTISSIKETKTKSRKELVIAYVNKLGGYSKQEKLLILHLAGYKTNEINQSALTAYLKNNGMNGNEIKEFLGVE
jgi:hypothetical protein